jgi:hypothetical protein
MELKTERSKLIDFAVTLRKKRTAKEKLWDDLVAAIWRCGKPSPTESETTSTELKNHTKKLKSQLEKTLNVLKKMEYISLLKEGTTSKDFIVANRVRQKSETMRANSIGTQPQFISAFIVEQEYEKKGECEKHYPFDHELSQAIVALEKISPYFDEVCSDLARTTERKGHTNDVKDNNDELIWALCDIYKQYTGEIPTSSMNADGVKATGKIIPFLQAILPHTAYIKAASVGAQKNLSLTDSALNARLRRLRNNKKYAPLWYGNKK